MNGFLEGVAVNLVSNVLWALATQLGLGTSEQPPRPTKTPPHRAGRPRHVDAAIQVAIAGALRATGSGGTRTRSQLERFLTSPEAHTIIRQLFAMQFVANDSGIAALEGRFCQILAAYAPDIPPSAAIGLFRALADRCVSTLQEKALVGDFAAGLALSNYRHRLLLNEIDAIARATDFSSSGRIPGLAEIDRFDGGYRKTALSRHGFITPPHLEVARKIAIDKIFVAPDLQPRADGRRDTEVPRLSMDEFLWKAHRAVILGNPGGGKTTLARKVIHRLLSDSDGPGFSGRQLVPFLVTLRDYGATKASAPQSLVQHIETTLSSRYQVDPPSGLVHYYLSCGRALVVFDGLDELTDTRQRRDIAEDIECFCALYPGSPVIVTSRLVGYDQAPLTAGSFEEYLLPEMSERQVREYVAKWFALDNTLEDAARKKLIRGFLRESALAHDLRVNPLLLGLMCTIYRGENYIPRNRPEVYDKCAKMLFERWDRSRGIETTGTKGIDSQVHNLICHLAYWIYENPSLHGGVVESAFVAEGRRFLLGRRFEDEMEAEQAAQDFMRFCSGRAWVLTDVGTTATGDRLFQFSHKTFLEYFAALHLVRRYPSPERLLQCVVPKIASGEWDVMPELACQLLSRNVDQAEDLLLDKLLAHALSADASGQLQLLEFASSTLAFLVPTPGTTRRVVEAVVASLERTLDNLHAEPAADYDQRRIDGISMLADLLNSTAENRDIVAAALLQRLEEWLGSRSRVRAIASTELLLTFPEIARGFWRRRQNLFSDETPAYWRAKATPTIDTHQRSIDAIANSSESVAQLLAECDRWGLDQLAHHHGVESLFVRRPTTLLPWTRLSVAEDLLSDAFFQLHAPSVRTAAFESICLSSPPPWTAVASERGYSPPGWLRTALPKRNSGPAFPGGYFLMFCLCAPILEAEAERAELIALAELAEDGSMVLSLDRVRRNAAAVGDRRLIERHLRSVDRERRTLIERWLASEVSLATPRRT